MAMARKPALRTVRNVFEDTIVSSRNLFTAVEVYTKRTYDGMEYEPLHPTQARRVVGLAFLAVLAAWEEYLEAVFVRYLAGATAPSGYSPTPRGGTVAASLNHSYQIITGKIDYDSETSVLSWTSPKKVIERAEIFFNQGQPFKSAIEMWRKQLQDAAKIRNRVAHASGKCRNEFKAVALQHLGRRVDEKLPLGYSAGDLLLETGNRGFPGRGAEARASTFFEAYMDMFDDLAERLAPG